MKTILGGLAAALMLSVGLMACKPAKAALPDAAYQGPIGPRLTKPATCVPGYAVLPAFLGGGDGPAGTYVWWNPATGKCEVGGRAAGPQF